MIDKISSPTTCRLADAIYAEAIRRTDPLLGLDGKAPRAFLIGEPEYRAFIIEMKANHGFVPGGIWDFIPEGAPDAVPNMVFFCGVRVQMSSDGQERFL